MPLSEARGNKPGCDCARISEGSICSFSAVQLPHAKGCEQSRRSVSGIS